MFDQKYLEELIKNKVEESLTLEYKASQALTKGNQKKTNEISKDVAAFANANGGIIIYGLIEEGHLPKSIDPIKRCEISREWLEQKIQDTIQPKIRGCQVHPIIIDCDDNNVVYLVEIPKSLTAHQSIDKKYYKRHNFNVLAMHDYEIRDIMNRATHPRIKLSFEIYAKTIYMDDSNVFRQNSSRENASVTNFELVVHAGNEGNVLAKYVNCDLEIPSVIFQDDPRIIDSSTKTILSLDNTVRDVLDVEVRFNQIDKKLGSSRFEPILPKRKLRLDSNFPKLVRDFGLYKGLEINWVVYADNSQPIHGKQLVSEINIVNN